jgi:hypothetical protein
LIREVTGYVEKKEYQTMFERLLADIDETVAARKVAEAKNLIFEQQILVIGREKEAAEREKETIEREKETAIRKLRELGVAEEIIAVSFSGK